MIRRPDPLENPEALVRRVYAFVAYRLGDGPDAEDATSETFARALRYRDSYRREKGEPIAWLIGIARHVIIEQAERTAEILDPERFAVEPEDDWVRRLDLMRAVGALQSRDRELIGLRYGADLSARQIGALLDIRTNTVEVALHRVLARLRVLAAAEAPERGSRPEQGGPEDAI